MENILLVTLVIVAIAMVVTVLLQRSEGGGLGIGGGGGGSAGGLMSVRGTANLLTRATAVLAALFMMLALALAVIASHKSAPESILDQPAASGAPAQPETKEGEVPISR